MRAMIDDELVRAHRARALSPDHPVLRGLGTESGRLLPGPRSRESVSTWPVPTIVQNVMDKFAKLVGREYKLFQYEGAPDAEHVIIIMGSGAEAVHETVDHLSAQGKKVGMLKVRLMRPFSLEHFLNALPATVKSIAVLDRTKEPGAIGEPLYQDVIIALTEGFTAGKAPMASFPKVIGGRYGLSSKEFTPAMVARIFDELTKHAPQNHFTIGINDDVTHTSLDYDAAFSTEPAETVRAMFFGLGSDGTVGANKNTIKIIGEETALNVQGYFVYDSKKSGAVTTSHLRFSKQPIRSTYLISRANFVACHQFSFMERLDVLKAAEPGAVFLLNSSIRAGRSLGQSAASGAGDHHPEKAAFLRNRCCGCGPQGRHGRPYQHRHADLLLRYQRRVAPRGSHRRHQACHREDLRQARRVRSAQELRGGGFLAREPPRGEGPTDGDLAVRRSPAGPGECS